MPEDNTQNNALKSPQTKQAAKPVIEPTAATEATATAQEPAIKIETIDSTPVASAPPPKDEPSAAEVELRTEAEAKRVAELKKKYSLPVEEASKSKGGKFSFRNLNTPMKVAIVVIGVSILGVLLIMLRYSNPVENADDALDEPISAVISIQAITLVELEGTAEISEITETLAGATFSELKKDDEIKENQFVRTADSSRAIIAFDDGTEVRLDSSTTIYIDTANAESIEITLGIGEIFSRVTESSNRTFKTNTSNDSYTALGTAFTTIQNENFEGIESYENKVKTADQTTVDEGEAYLRDKNTSDDPILSKLDLEKVKTDEFLLWNRDRDLSKDEYKDKLGFLKDFEGPKLAVSAPSNNLNTEAEKVTVKGITDKDAKVTINGVEVSVAGDSGGFNHSISLVVGANKIALVATDPAGNTSKKNLTVTRKEKVVEETPNITLVGETGTTGIDLSWSLKEGVEAPDGYKVVYSTGVTPVYGTDASQFSDDLGTVLPKKDGKQYKIRICIYDADANKCANYSNEVKVTAPPKET